MRIMTVEGIRMHTILVVEDDHPIANLIRLTLEEAGYNCEVAHDGQIAADLIAEKDYDLVLLDIMLPNIDGYELMDYIEPLGIPVIFVSAKSDPRDHVKGLRMGAFDYINKPFDDEELVARVDNILRHAGGGKSEIAFKDLMIFPESRQVSKNGLDVSLTPREYDLLLVLLRNPGKNLLREYLYDQIWGEESEQDTRTLDTHIQRLRRKLDLQDTIVTVYKVGYRLEDR